ncbi:YggT family protein [Phytobacter palmae]|uniref:YggT family protein n=1 Tax=Phytobacter palmae TaxID=1855371 RepID=A0ABU9V2V2_9ENTR|nr:YggT family protein [Escherichia coli]SFE15798.1 YggT family protein [Phytobacter palmae]
MNTLSTLLSLIIQAYTMVLLLRIWMQWARCDFYNPFSQFIVKITQPIVGPLRRIIPAMGPIDSASLLIALLLCVVKAFLNPYVSMDGVLIVLAAVLIVIKTLGSLIFWVLLLMAIMSWVSQGRSPVEYVLLQLTEPLLRPIRRLLPSMGGLDFSPMILVLLMYVINMGVMEFLANTVVPLAYIWNWA